MSVEVVSLETAQEILGCKRRRVFELLADGTLERAPRYGRALRIFRASIDRALCPTAKRRKARSSPERWNLADVPLESQR